jgi:ATP-dependent protease ClpP protease subunit
MPGKMIEILLSAKAQEALSSPTFHLGFKNATGDGPAEVLIYGEIGDPYAQGDAKGMGQFLRANKGRAINVRINSPGGLAYDGITIHNALVAHDGPVTTIVEGLAASAASIIAMAGKPAKIYENAQLMIHRAQGSAQGNRGVMLEIAEWLQAIDEAIAQTYRAKTGKGVESILKLMDGKVDGTVFSAKEAKSHGFVDEIVRINGDKKAVASCTLTPAQIMEAKRVDSRREFLNQA